MRTTLDIDDAVLRAARELAHQRRISLGQALSEIARRGLDTQKTETPEGFPLIPRFGDHVITDDLVAIHRDDSA